MRAVAIIGAVLLIFSLMAGCGTQDRISRLEKQNEDLRAQVRKDQATADFDLRAKCSRDAKGWFQENWATSDKSTVFLDYSDHYNQELNKCFILVEYHYSLDSDGSWINHMSLWDVYENVKYGEFIENHPNFSKATLHSDKVIGCELRTNKCASLEEFDNLVRPYLGN